MTEENVFIEVKEGMKWNDLKKILTKYNCEDVSIYEYFKLGEFSFPHGLSLRERKLHISNFNRHFDEYGVYGGLTLWGDSPMLEYIKANHRELNYEKELAIIQAESKVSKVNKQKNGKIYECVGSSNLDMGNPFLYGEDPYMGDF